MCLQLYLLQLCLCFSLLSPGRNNNDYLVSTAAIRGSSAEETLLVYLNTTTGFNSSFYWGLPVALSPVFSSGCCDARAEDDAEGGAELVHGGSHPARPGALPQRPGPRRS